MADVYKQSFKQNYTNNIELSILTAVWSAVLRGRPGVPASGTTTSSIWSSRARACSRSAGAPTR